MSENQPPEPQSRSAWWPLSPQQWRFVALLGVITLLLGVLYAATFVDFVQAWTTYEEYNYALFVPFIALGLLIWRWPQLRTIPMEPSSKGFYLLGVGLLSFLFGNAVGVHVVQGLSLIPVLLGLVWLFWGARAARMTLFPIGYLGAGFGLYRGLANSLGFAMQGLTARNATTLAHWLGVPVHRDGLLLNVGQMTFVVAEACSGLSSLLALLAIGWLLLGVTPGSLWTKVLLALAITPVALLANTIRVAMVMFIAKNISTAVAEGFVHGLFSAMIFIITLSFLLIFQQVLARIDRSISRSSPQLPQP